MDFDVRRDAASLDSTAYMEIGPGKYAGKHWQPGFIFVSEAAFQAAEGLLLKSFPAYDHFSTNDIPLTEGASIAADLRAAAQALALASSSDDAAQLLLIPQRLRLRFTSDFVGQRTQLSDMLDQLAAAFESGYRSQDHVCILGM